METTKFQEEEDEVRKLAATQEDEVQIKHKETDRVYSNKKMVLKVILSETTRDLISREKILQNLRHNEFK